MNRLDRKVGNAYVMGGVCAFGKLLLRSWIEIGVVAGLLLLCGGAAGATWYVEGSVAESGDGTSWSTAFELIQEGIDAASDGDTVVVAPGTYAENVDFEGKNIVLRSRASHIVSWTVIDGSQAGAVVSFSGTEDESCVVSGFTIRNGKAKEGAGAGICGGTADQHTRATIENNVITGNVGLEGNSHGGGVAYCDGMIRNNTITGNTVVMRPIYPGQSSEGGGLYKCNGTIRNNIISDNSAEPAGKGGGLFRCNGRIENNTISGNCAAYGGGLFGCEGTVVNNIIESNASYDDGGGLYVCNGTIQSNLIMGNWAGYGGGLCDCDGTILNNTIVGNWTTAAEGVGGGLYGCNGDIGNCIIWGNRAFERPQLFACGKVVYSCIEGWEDGGEGNIALDPGFLDADGPDGDLETLGDNDYRVSEGSPCIDAGDNSVLTPPGMDLDGDLRIAFGGRSLTVDMGAYEYDSSRYEVMKPVVDGGGIRLSWNSQPNDTYTVWSCVELSSGVWVEEATIASQGATTSWTDGGPLGRTKFHRIEIK